MPAIGRLFVEIGAKTTARRLRREGDPHRPGVPHLVRIGPEPDPEARRGDHASRARRHRIAEREKEFTEAAQVNDVKRAEALAPEIVRLKELLKAYDEFPRALQQWQAAWDETRKIAEEFN